MRYQMDSQNAGELESSAYVAIDRDPISNPAIFVDCSDLPSLTRQEFAAEADINVLMEKYEKTGLLTPQMLSTREPQYLDVSDVPDLQSAMAIVRDAETAFMRLPAKTRLEFENDPMRFIAFAENPENLERMREWGLAPPLPEKPAPTEVIVTNPAPPPES